MKSVGTWRRHGEGQPAATASPGTDSYVLSKEHSLLPRTCAERHTKDLGDGENSTGAWSLKQRLRGKRGEIKGLLFQGLPFTSFRAPCSHATLAH